MEHQVATPATLAAALALALVHLHAGRLRLLDRVPRSRWLSTAGGVSVAYVLVHLLPEVARAQRTVAERAEGVAPYLEQHAYLLALAGLALFYGVENASLRSRERRRRAGERDATGRGAFALSVASFAAYNAMIGYLLVRGEAESGAELATFAVALGLHFVVNDVGLREHHRDDYHRVGRWLLAAAVLGGWAVAQATQVSEQALALVLAFIAGGVILNVMKEELPGERQARFVPFALAAALYAALLQAL